MTKKEIIEALNNLATKIDSVDEPKEQPKYPEGILSFKTCYDQIVSFKNQVGNYQDWCNGHLGKERENIVPSTIYSVQNSKGEILQVGDTVKADIWEFNIVRFEIVRGDIFVPMDKGLFLIENITKVEKQQPSWKDQIVAFKSKRLFYVMQRCRGDVFQFAGAGLMLSKPIDAILNDANGFEIFTVKNKAGIEFSIGDDTNYGKIKSFLPCQVSETKGSFQVISDGGAISFNYPLDEYVKVKPKEVLFNTHDGVNIYDNDPYFSVDDRLIVLDEIATKLGWQVGNVKFKNKNNAERFIAENKKSISFKELEDYAKKKMSMIPTPPYATALEEILDHFTPKQ